MIKGGKRKSLLLINIKEDIAMKNLLVEEWVHIPEGGKHGSCIK